MAFRAVSWYVSASNQLDPHFPIHKLDWDFYTHIRIAAPLVMPNGTVFCDRTNKIIPKIVNMAHNHNTKVQWGVGVKDIWNFPNHTIKQNFLESIGDATNACNIDGVGVDYEWQDTKWGKIGVVTPHQSTLYTEFLASLKKALGPGKIVSADISIWGMAPGNYLLGVFPWINASMLNEGKIDFVNTMSYHWNKDGNIWSWEKDAFFIDLWKIDRKRVNIGIPYFSKVKKNNQLSEPLWNDLSQYCPNIHPSLNTCQNITFVGKKMNEDIGKFVKDKGFGGVFPWAANYDSYQHNNSLVKWLAKGLYGA